MSASNKGGYGGPNTAGPGGQGRDYNGNARGSRMPGQFAIGGAPRMGGPAYGGRPAPGDLYRPGISDPIFPPGVEIRGGPALEVPQPAPAVMPPQPGNRFQPRGMIPPAGGRIGNPRQINQGGGGRRPGQIIGGRFPNEGQPDYGYGPGIVDPGFNAPIPRLVGGGGKGGFQGPSTMENPRGPDGRYLLEDIVPDYGNEDQRYFQN